MNNKTLIIIILVLAAGAAGFWYWRNKKESPASSIPAASAPVTENASGNVGGAIFEKTQEPLKDKFPETNPLRRVMINPFE